MTTTLPQDAWVPVPLRWRHVVAGDVFTGRDGRLWSVMENAAGHGTFATTVYCGTDRFLVDVDPDEIIPVLIPVTEVEAVELTRDQLGARVVQRRTASDAEQALPEPPELSQE